MNKAYSNDIHAIKTVFGIEAAARAIKKVNSLVNLKHYNAIYLVIFYQVNFILEKFGLHDNAVYIFMQEEGGGGGSDVYQYSPKYSISMISSEFCKFQKVIYAFKHIVFLLL